MREFDYKKYSFLPVLFTLVFVPFGVQNALTLFLIALTALFFFYHYGKEDKFLAIALLVGFIVRAMVAVIDDKLALLPYAWDDFYTAAVHIKDNIQTGYPLFYDIDKSIHLKSYSAFNSLFLLILGNYEISIRLFNCILGVLVAERIYRICLFLKLNSRVARTALLLTLFWPSFILFNSLNMRDTLIIFLSIDMLYRFLRNSERARFIDTVILIVEFILLTVLRTQNALVYVSMLGVYILYSRARKGRLLDVFTPIPVIVVIAAFFVFYFASQYFDGILRYINVEMKWRAVGGSAYLIDQSYNSWLDVVKWAPIRFIYFSFGPFPWNVRNGFMLLAFFESAAFLVFFIFTIRFILSKKIFSPSPQVVLLLSFAVIGLLANSIIDSNYGTAIRHKMNYIVIFFIFASAFIEELRVRIL